MATYGAHSRRRMLKDLGLKVSRRARSTDYSMQSKEDAEAQVGLLEALPELDSSGYESFEGSHSVARDFGEKYGRQLSYKASTGTSISTLDGTVAGASCWEDLRYVLFVMILGKHLNILLVLLPIGYVAAAFDWSPTAIFLINFAALVPVASLLGDFTEELAVHTGEVIGGLVNATFGNAVEMVISIQALRQNQLVVVKNSLLGSIFSNALLVLGCCFFAGGCKRGFKAEPTFNGVAAVANTSVLILSALAMILPPVLPTKLEEESSDGYSLLISRIAAIMLLLLYIQLLIFQLWTHKERFAGGGDGAEETASIGATAAVVGLTGCTVIVSIWSDFLVASIDGFADQGNFSPSFVGVVLLPIVGNAVEHIAAVTVAYKEKMDLAIGIALGSSTQVAIFVVPFTIVVGWIMNKPMTFCLPTHEFVLYITMLIVVCQTVSNGSTNWIEGSMLVMT
eukprot:scaffold48_cov311-Pinguiococcus_pyrenoidosus.AAC.221